MTQPPLRSVGFSLTLLVLVLFSADAASAQAQSTDLDRWLTLGPVTMPMPAFAEEDGVDGSPYRMQELMQFCVATIDDWWPEVGEEFRWDSNTTLTWTAHSGSEVPFSPASADQPEFGWAATYVEVDRWAAADIHVESRHPFKLLLNGREIASKSTVEEAADEPQAVTESVELEQGKHLVVVQSLKAPDVEAGWNLQGHIEPQNPSDAAIRVSTARERRVNMTDLTDSPGVSSLAVAPGGEHVAVTVTQQHPPEGDGESRIEIRTTDNGERVRTYSGGMDLGALQWAPDGQRFTYVDRTSEGADLWLVDLNAGSQDRLMRGVEDFSSYTWSPEGSFIIYSRTEEPPADESGVRRLEYLEDRRPGFRTRSFLYRLNVPEGTTQRLTAGALTTSLNGISPDGEQLLFSRSHITYEERPFSRREFALLDLQTLEVDSLFSAPFAGSAQWSPDGTRLLLSGGPSMFGELGQNVSAGMVANDYDTQAYIYSLETEDIEPITRAFAPSINQLRWSEFDDAVYLTTTDQSFVNLYRYDLSEGTFSLVETEGDAIHQFDLARDQPIAAYSASGASQPATAHLLDLASGSSARLLDPTEEVYEPVQFGEVRDWAFTNERGDEIEGHVYYPPGFDNSREYPVIVYYYGGTTPVTRSYGGRYPKELWAAKDYLVYVLQPSGAIGYGQEFSALHVNDWGEIVADEIIDGVSQFLNTHTYADPERVGAIGASFGGFMTMLLQTRTDMFAAAVSHAGISNITSYWGEGFWGFQYSAIATAESYPWDRPDIYVDRSPIFDADQITTPLLLLHGDADTNVPPGESIQMFTALQLLGRDVAYVEVEDQDHHILEYNKYIDWSNTIMAWFDRWLKDEPEWWEATL